MSNDRVFLKDYNDIHFNEEFKQYESLGEFTDDYSTKQIDNFIFLIQKILII